MTIVRVLAIALTGFMMHMVVPQPAVGGELAVALQLIPYKHWSAEPNPALLLKEGRVTFFRDGSRTDFVEAELTEPVLLGEGQWTWIAETEEFVTASSGVVSVGPDCRAGEPKLLLWWAVPACTVVDQDERPSLDEHVDLVSLDFGSVHPLLPSLQRTAKVPSGRFLAYSVSQGQITAFSSVQTCPRDSTIELPAMEPPTRSEFDLLAQLVHPEPAADSQHDIPLAYISGRNGDPIVPTAVATSRGLSTFFFLGMEAPVRGPEMSLVVESARWQTMAKDFEALGGSIVELSNLELFPRRELSVWVDYRPAREHNEQTLLISECTNSGCRSIEGKELSLEVGLKEYVFPDLDWGTYLINAEIDGFVLEGLGRPMGEYYTPSIPKASGDDQQDRFGSNEIFELKEHHIYGNLLLDEDPVPGYVQLSSPPGLGTELSPFPTDDDLVYHLFFFASKAGKYDLTPAERENGASPEDMPLVLPSTYSIDACSTDGICRGLNRHSWIRGEGRWDIPLLPDGGVEFSVAVRDSDTGAPIEGARVLVRDKSPAILFDEGRLEEHDPPGMEGAHFVTSKDGTVTLRTTEGEVGLLTMAKGYDSSNRRIQARAGEERIVQLSRAKRRATDFRLVTEFGHPLDHAVLLPIDDQKARVLDCLVVTDELGFGRLIPRCIGRQEQFVVLHKEAEIVALSEHLLRSSAELTLTASPPPISIRLATPEGHGIPGVGISLAFSDFTLTPNDLLVGARGKGMLFYLSDAAGRLLLRGVNPHGVDVPDLVLDSDRLSLSGLSPGDHLEFIGSVD